MVETILNLGAIVSLSAFAGFGLGAGVWLSFSALDNLAAWRKHGRR